MKAGRGLDRLVAEKVMGLEPSRVDDDMQAFTWRREFLMAGDYFIITDEGTEALPHYSTDIAAAWQVVEALAKSPHWIGVIVGTFGIPHAKCYRNSYLVSEVWINLDNVPDSRTYSERCAGAICMAALKAVGVEVE